MVTIQAYRKNWEKELKTINPGRRKEPTVLGQTGHQRPGVLHLHRTGTPDADKVSAGWAGQVGLPEGEPDRCNMDRCPADPAEGDIPR